MDNVDAGRVYNACAAFGQFLAYATHAVQIGALDTDVAQRMVLSFVEGAKSVMTDKEIAEFIPAIEGGITDILDNYSALLEGAEFLTV